MPTSGTTVQLITPAQLQNAVNQQQATVIDMRAVQTGQQVQQVQHLQHPGLIEQVIHVAQIPTTMAGGRQEIKYDIVPATVDMGDMNQIMNLIKVKGHPQ